LIQRAFAIGSALTSRLDGVIRFAADENLNDAITRGLRRRQPEADIVRIQDVGLSGAAPIQRSCNGRPSRAVFC